MNIPMILFKKVHQIIDSTEKDVLMNANGLGSDEKLDRMIIEDKFIKMKYIICGHISNVPN